MTDMTSHRVREHAGDVKTKKCIATAFLVALAISGKCYSQEDLTCNDEFRLSGGGAGATSAGNYDVALKYYRKSADCGFKEGQFHLGFMYAEGLGVPQNYATAFRLFHSAAIQGDPRSAFNLGVEYANGQGVLQDYIRAHMWFNIASAEMTDAVFKDEASQARQYRDSVEKKLSMQQTLQAQNMANECIASQFRRCN